ncbi:hypothetical protein [Streptomyces sp. NPDC047315]|uniref:hypothetical protein n=1 Tax=Streptomyces sp. NPDC047315 TaxID=3155142 RepID=UPI0033D93661
MTSLDVQGLCPACRAASLFVADGGYVTCARLECPNPVAADDLLHGEKPPPADRVDGPGTTTGIAAEAEPADLRARIARALHRYDNDHGLTANDIPTASPANPTPSPAPDPTTSSPTDPEGNTPMGWGSAYRIFNTVADALIKANATDETKEQTLTALIAGLRDGDWDTELDSLQNYLDDPAIVRAFATNDIHWPEG